MADVLLFHHAQGLTKGVTAFADELRSAGHTVTVPDLYDGLAFSSVEEGVTHAKSLGFEALLAAGVAAADGLPNNIVYGGFSLGLMPAQKLAQQRPGARGALLYHGGVPVTEFGEVWPDGVPLQAHVMQDDPWGDVEDVKELVDQAGGELFLYEGNAHLFTDSSLDAYDPDAAKLVIERTLAFSTPSRNRLFPKRRLVWIVQKNLAVFTRCILRQQQSFRFYNVLSVATYIICKKV